MFNWTVSSMDYNVSQDSHTNVVTIIHWRCSKEDESGNAGSSYGTVGLEAPGESFVEWANITEEVALGWAKAALGDEQVAAIEASIDAQIAEQANPTRGMGVPWTA